MLFFFFTNLAMQMLRDSDWVFEQLTLSYLGTVVKLLFFSVLGRNYIVVGMVRQALCFPETVIILLHISIKKMT